MMCGRRFPVIPRREVEAVLAAAREARQLAPGRLFRSSEPGRLPLVRFTYHPAERHYENPWLSKAERAQRWQSLSVFAHHGREL